MNTTRLSSITALRREIKLLRSFVIGAAGKDDEGQYRPEFVRKILAASAETPKHRFTTAQSFFKQLQ